MLTVARRVASNAALCLHASHYSVHATLTANYVQQVCQNHNVDCCATSCVKICVVSACVPLLITYNIDS